MTSPARAPASSTPRLAGLDVARAAAIVGMVVVNFRYATGAEMNAPRWLKELTGLLDGRAAAAFVVLAGVSLTLLGERAVVEAGGDRGAGLRQATRVLRLRGAVLFVLGMAHTWLWPPDILHFYGLYLPLSAWALRRSGGWLAGGIGAVVAAFVGMVLTLDYEAGWSEGVLDSGEFWTPLGFVRDTIYNGYHALLPWLAFVWLGMALGRLDWRRRSTRRRLLAAGLWVTLVAEVGSRLGYAALPESLYIHHFEAWDVLLNTTPYPPTPLYLAAAGGSAVALVAGCAELATRYPGARWLRGLQAMGRASLTIYVAHTTLGLWTLGALGWTNAPPLENIVFFSIIFCIISYASSYLLIETFQRVGPMEALMRWVVRWAAQR